MFDKLKASYNPNNQSTVRGLNEHHEEKEKIASEHNESWKEFPGHNHEHEDRKRKEEMRLENEIEDLIKDKRYQDALDKLCYIESKLNQSNPKTYVNMALCQKELGQFIQSVKSLQIAVNLDPSLASSNSSKKHYKENQIILKNSNDI